MIRRMPRVVLALLLFPCAAAQAATVRMVTNLNDSGEGSLRAAMALIQPGSGDSVDARGVEGTISLQSPLPATATYAIEGPGRDKLILDGMNQHRVFTVSPGEILQLNYLTVTRGRQTANGAGGGAIYGEPATGGLSGGSVSLANCAVTNSSTSGNDAPGGAILAENVYINTESLVQGNHTSGARSNGGALFARNSLSVGTSTVRDNRVTGNNSYGGAGASLTYALYFGSVIADNSASGAHSGGGAIYGEGSTDIYQSTFTGNHTQGTVSGGGAVMVANHDYYGATISRSIFENNFDEATSGPGGGAIAGDLVVMTRSELINNRSVNGVDGIAISVSLGMEDSILVQAQAGETICNFQPYGVANFIAIPGGGDGGCGAGSLKNGVTTTLAALKLGPLADNGGYAPTRALLAGSVAINAAQGSDCTTDARGMPKVGGACDAGSYEYATGGDGQPVNVLPKINPFGFFTSYTTVAALPANVRAAYPNARLVAGLDFVLQNVFAGDGLLIYQFPASQHVDGVIKCSVTAPVTCSTLPTGGSGSFVSFYGDEVTLVLKDNDLYDDDPVNTRIHDPVYFVSLTGAGGPPGAGSSGGGGALDWTLLAGLLAAAARRRSIAQRQR